jgi:hypothetical protein
MTPDPISSTAQWLDAACGGKPIPSLLIVVGIDEGHLLDVLDKRGSSAKVLAIEPDRAMAGTFQSRRDLNTWRSSGRLTHLVHPDYSGADEAWRMFPNNANDCLLMVNPRLKEGSPEVAAAARTAQKILYGVRANAAARRQFAPRYLTNVIRNIPAIATGGDVRALTNAFQGIPAVIAAAGPSLDAAIPELQRMNGQGLLIAVDTALRPMLEAGITPQLVTALDPSLLNARHFQMLADCPDTWLVAESALDRGAAAPFDGRTFWLRIAKHHPWPWLNACGIEVGHIDVWGSVLTGAFQLACVAGCDPIIFVGADLAFTGGRPYCRGTTYEFHWAWSTSIGRSLEQAWQHHIDSTKPHASVDRRRTTWSRHRGRCARCRHHHGHIDGPVEEIGHHVGAALIGTFLGILLSYGVVQPIAQSLEQRVGDDQYYCLCIKAGLLAVYKGNPPAIAVEFARRVLPHTVRPSFNETEQFCRAATKAPEKTAEAA